MRDAIKPLRQCCKNCTFWDNGCRHSKIVPEGTARYIPSSKNIEIFIECDHWTRRDIKEILGSLTYLSGVGWRSSKPNNLSGAGYGIKLNKIIVNLWFNKQWNSIKLILDNSIIEVPIRESFWKGTYILRHRSIGRWFLLHSIAPWPFRKPPSFLISAPKGNVFSVKPTEPLGRSTGSEKRRANSESFYKTADELLEEAKMEDAMIYFDLSIENNPQNAKAWAGKGTCFSILGSVNEAKKCFNRAIRLNGLVADAWVGIGLIIEANESRNKALAWFDQKIKQKPDSPFALFGKGCYMAEIGDYENAIISYDAAQKLQPDLKEISDIRDIVLKKMSFPSIKSDHRNP